MRGGARETADEEHPRPAHDERRQESPVRRWEGAGRATSGARASVRQARRAADQGERAWTHQDSATNASTSAIAEERIIVMVAARRRYSRSLP